MNLRIGFAGKMAGLLICFLFTLNSVWAQTEYKVYAGLMYHFIKYSQWPSAGNEVVLGIVGKTPMNTEAHTLNGKMAGSMKITVKEIGNIADIGSCQILFVPSNLAAHYAEIAAQAKQHHILVVSNSPGATKGGVVINFFEEESKIKFEISNKNASTYGLKIAADLLKLARVVD